MTKQHKSLLAGKLAGKKYRPIFRTVAIVALSHGGAIPLVSVGIEMCSLPRPTIVLDVDRRVRFAALTCHVCLALMALVHEPHRERGDDERDHEVNGWIRKRYLGVRHNAFPHARRGEILVDGAENVARAEGDIRDENGNAKSDHQLRHCAKQRPALGEGDDSAMASSRIATHST